jgi:hypothetical protein
VAALDAGASKPHAKADAIVVAADVGFVLNHG